MAELEAAARRAMDKTAWDYYAGGAGEEITLRENEAAWSAYRLRPRVLVDVSAVSTRASLLGHDLATPVLIAPSGLQRLAHEDGELAVARAAAAAGTIYVMSTAATATPQEVVGAAPDCHRWWQLDLHRDRAHSRAAIELAVELGFTAVVLTVDTPGPGERRRDLRNGFSVPPHLTVPGIPSTHARPDGGIDAANFYAINDPSTTWHDLETLVGECPVPLLVKGVQAGDDARRAHECGAAAIVVSNHGGRQLDGVAATADVLPEVVQAVGGDLPVLVDGGIRRARDVIIALALGASAVLVGRPILWGLVTGGEDGCYRVLDGLRQELENALALLGCPDLEAIGPQHLHSRRPPLDR